MDNDKKNDNIKDGLLMMYDVLPREYQIKLCLYAVDLLEENAQVRKKEERDREFNRQLKAAISAREYTC